MIRTQLFAILAGAALLTPTPGLADVTVRFINPERYSDAESSGAPSREATLVEIRSHLQRLGERVLAPGQSLTIDVLDIDLAGQKEPWRPLSDVRIMRGVTPPSFRLRYVLREKGKPAQSGDDTITDLNYQMNPSARFFNDPFSYEKALLDDWIRRIVGGNGRRR